jgi:phenylalanyl-tRNA synthetase beta chain
MKFSENWLNTWLASAMDGNAIADKLTMSGLEVESRESFEPGFKDVVVARVVSVAQHPKADRLKVCQVTIGGSELLQIVCGATNVTEGATVPCALVGAQVGELLIKQADLRGVTSNGMLCSAKELGLSTDGAGLLVLPKDAPLGAGLSDYLELNDALITLKLTPNRGDCLSVKGLAREISALTNVPLHPAQFDLIPITLSDQRQVHIENADACGVYCGRVIKLANANSSTPQWMKSRLERSGLRPISVVVDVTNYVMLELGQPLHAFDNDKLSGDIAVRFAQNGGALRLLNHEDATLSSDMVVIADSNGPIALGGVMGGEASSVTDATRSIFLESAFFPPNAIAGRARRLSLTSDAAYRFERGVDFAGTRNALERATQLIISICGGEVGTVTTAQATLPGRDSVLVRPARIERVLGIKVTASALTEILTNLGCTCVATEGGYQVTPPSHRFDLAIEADFIEEFARVYGYDNIPAAVQVSSAVLLPQTQSQRSVADISQRLSDRDYQEILTYSFVSPDMEKDFSPERAPIPLRNPIAEQMGVMRTTLLIGLIDTLRFNLNRKQERVRVFEIGRCFIAGDNVSAENAVNQAMRVGGLCYGNRYQEQWGERARLVDFFDVKADLEAIFHHVKIEFKKITQPTLHPGRSAGIFSAGEQIGYLAELHPILCQKYEFSSAPIAFELELKPLLEANVTNHETISKFPNVRRDIAVVVNDAIPAQDLIASLYSTAPKFVRDIQLFDQFRGGNLENGKKSLAFRVVMNDTEKTLTEEEIEKIDQSLKQTLVSLHQAQLRS